MTQVPQPSQRPSAVPVVPESAEAPERPLTGQLARNATALMPDVLAAIQASPNHAWLTLPGPVDLAPAFAKAIADAVASAGWRPPRRRPEKPDHGMPPVRNSLPPGFLVGYIAELDDDTEGPQFMGFSDDVLPTEDDARERHDDAEAWRPGWRIYQLTDITEIASPSTDFKES